MISQRKPVLLAIIAWTVLAGPVAADEEFRHEARVMGKMGNHPNSQIPFTGSNNIEVEFRTDAAGYTNPVYVQGETVIYNSEIYIASANPGTPESLQSISFLLDTTGRTAFLHSEGIVHRDIAARNILVQANGGTYESSTQEVLLFGNDGPTDIRTNIGPVRWMAPESLRLHRTGSADPNDYIDVQPFVTFFEVDYVPEPGSLVLLCMGSVAVARPTRRHR